MPARALTYVPLIATGDQWPHGSPLGPACRLSALVRLLLGKHMVYLAREDLSNQ
jgi:hypothetical protein